MKKSTAKVAEKEHQLFVIPREGLIVRFPGIAKHRVLPETGAHVPRTGPDGRYWRRRITSGDVTLAKPEPVKVEKTTRFKREV